MTHMETIPLTITAPSAPNPPAQPYISVSQISGSIQTAPGVAANLTLSVAGFNGWTGPVTFSSGYANDGLSVCIVSNSGCVSSLSVPVPGTVTYQLSASGYGFYNASAIVTPPGGPAADLSIDVVQTSVPSSFQISLPNTITIPAYGAVSEVLNVITQGTPPALVTLSSGSDVSFSQSTITSFPGSSLVTFDAGQRAPGTVYTEIVRANGGSQAQTVNITVGRVGSGGPARPQITGSCFLGSCSEFDVPNDTSNNTFTWYIVNDTPQNLTGCTASSAATPSVPVSINILSTSTTDTSFVVDVQASITSSTFYQNVTCYTSDQGASAYAPSLYVYDSTPVITGISPSWVSPGSNTISISGHNFGANPVVTIAGVNYALSNVPLTDSQVLSVTFNVSQSAGSSLAVNVTSQGEPTNGTAGFFVYSQTKPSASHPVSLTMTLPVTNPVTIYLLHGIGQTSDDMKALYLTLTNPAVPSGLQLSRYVVDAGFSFGDCSTQVPVVQPCTVSRYGDSCGVDAGAQSLARYILGNPPPGNIVLIGYSMGGLIARQLIASSYLATGLPAAVNGSSPAVAGIASSIVGLITLGTPNLGYPYDPADEVVNCPFLDRDMAGSWQPQLTPALELSSQAPSIFLQGLVQQWQTASFKGYWLAAAGTSCTNSIRNFPSEGLFSRGCISPPNTITPAYSDGIVCRDSAIDQAYLQFPGFVSPPSPATLGNSTWEDPEHKYVHTNAANGFGSGIFFCTSDTNFPSSPTYFQLFTPPTGGLLILQMVQTINAH